MDIVQQHINIVSFGAMNKLQMPESECQWIICCYIRMNEKCHSRIGFALTVCWYQSTHCGSPNRKPMCEDFGLKLGAVWRLIIFIHLYYTDINEIGYAFAGYVAFIYCVLCFTTWSNLRLWLLGPSPTHRHAIHSCCLVTKNKPRLP